MNKDLHFEINDIVDHPEFGRGRIIQIIKDGDEAKHLEIEFRQIEKKNMMPIGGYLFNLTNDGTPSNWTVGDQVEHVNFGKGEIVSIYEQQSPNASFVIAFTLWMRRKTTLNSVTRVEASRELLGSFQRKPEERIIDQHAPELVEWQEGDLANHTRYGPGRVLKVINNTQKQVLEIEFRESVSRGWIDHENERVVGEEILDPEYGKGTIAWVRIMPTSEVTFSKEDKGNSSMFSADFVAWTKRRIDTLSNRLTKIDSLSKPEEDARKQPGDYSRDLTEITSVEHLTMAVETYKKVGLFKHRQTEDIVRDYVKELDDSYGEGDGPGLELQTFFILKANDSGVYIGWHEAGVFEDSDKYVELIEDCAQLSHGAFTPQNIIESWESDTGPISVEFTIGEAVHRYMPQYMRRYMDFSILQFLNGVISNSSKRFEMIVDDCLAPILFLSQEEKEFLISELSLVFSDCPNIPRDDCSSPG